VENLRVFQRVAPSGLRARLRRTETKLRAAGQARTPAACARRVRNALKVVRALERFTHRLVGTGPLIAPDSARQMAAEGTRLRTRAEALAGAYCRVR
jgi:hypothetical protein